MLGVREQIAPPAVARFLGATRYGEAPMAITTSNAFTIEDLEALPDDGHRYELIGGAIMITPAPEPVHQRVSGRLFRLIADA